MDYYIILSIILYDMILFIILDFSHEVKINLAQIKILMNNNLKER